MPDNKAEQPQIDKFRELARALECDDEGEAFTAKLRQVAKAPREAPKPKPPVE